MAGGPLTRDTATAFPPSSGLSGLRARAVVHLARAGDSRWLRCGLSTHPLGWELRLSFGDELVKSQVCRTQDSDFETGDVWRAEATATSVDLRSTYFAGTRHVKGNAEVSVDASQPERQTGWQHSVIFGSALQIESGW